MSSDLEQFRDHARFMAGREHAPGCPPVRQRPGRAHNRDRKWCGDDTTHSEHAWQQGSPLSDFMLKWRCAGFCGGCQDPATLALWTRLADEIDGYLGTGADDETLEGL